MRRRVAHNALRWGLLTAWLAGCPGPERSTDETDPVEEGDCVAVSTEASLTIVDPVPVETMLTVTSTCADDRALGIPEFQLLSAGFVVLPFEDPVVPAGGSVSTPWTFTPTVVGRTSDILRLEVEGQEAAELPIEVDVLGPELELVVEPRTIVRTCPSTLSVEIRNTGGGTARFGQVTWTRDGQALDGWSLPETDAVLDPGATTQQDLALTLDVASTQLAIEAEVALIDSWSRTVVVQSDPTAERELSVAPWEAGRPVDLFVQIDRRMPGFDREATEAGLRSFLSTLQGQDVDYRIVGLTRRDGCPLTTSGPIDRSLRIDEAVARLSAELDLAFNRLSETGVEGRALAVAPEAVSADNTKPGGCNDWCRPDAALVFVIAGHADDATPQPVPEIIEALREAVPFDDHLAIASLVPFDCTDLPEATRIVEASSLTDGVWSTLCAGEDIVNLGLLARAPGEENQIRLPEPPYPPSLEVLVDGRPVEATLDGTRLLLPRIVDRFRDEIVVRYIPADRCP